MPLHEKATGSPDSDPTYPGYEIGYDQITSAVNIASTTEATPTTIIACASHPFDGNPVLLDVYFSAIEGSSTASIIQLNLMESSTELGVLLVLAGASASSSLFWGVRCAYRFTPSAGSHTYTIGGFTNNSGGTQAAVKAGTGGIGGYLPGYARFTKV